MPSRFASMLFGIDYIHTTHSVIEKGDAVHKKLLDALPFLSADPSACRWVCLQEDLLCAPNTIDTYARGQSMTGSLSVTLLP